MTAKTVATTPDPSIAAAEKRYTEAHSNLASFQKTIIAIIAAKDWEVLGYENFAKYWIDRFSDITIALELRPHVIYELLREGSDIDSIADAVKGITPAGVTELKRKREIGVPPEIATTKPGQRRRKGKSDVNTVFIPLSPTHKAKWEAAAAKQSMKLVEYVISVVDAAH